MTDAQRRTVGERVTPFAPGAQQPGGSRRLFDGGGSNAVDQRVAAPMRRRRRSGRATSRCARGARGSRRRAAPAPRPLVLSGPSAGPKPLSRRWCAANSAPARASLRSAGCQSTRPSTLSANSTATLAAWHAATRRCSHSALTRSSSAEAVTRVARANGSASRSRARSSSQLAIAASKPAPCRRRTSPTVLHVPTAGNAILCQRGRPAREQLGVVVD
jgi:hypothetical protein